MRPLSLVVVLYTSLFLVLLTVECNGSPLKHRGINSFVDIFRNMFARNRQDGEGLDWEDPEDLHDSDKRQADDYGHMRFGKRADFDDYGHMRFGRSSIPVTVERHHV